MLYLDNPLRALGLSGDAPTERIVAAISSASPMLTVFDDGRFLAGTDAIARLGERHARLLARAAWFTGSTPLDREALAILDGGDIVTALEMWGGSDELSARGNAARAMHLGLIVRDLLPERGSIDRRLDDLQWEDVLKSWSTLLSDTTFRQSLLALDGDGAAIPDNELRAWLDDVAVMLIGPSIELIVADILAGREEKVIAGRIGTVRDGLGRFMVRSDLADAIVARLREHFSRALEAILADVDRGFDRGRKSGEMVRVGYERWVKAGLEPFGRMKRLFDAGSIAPLGTFCARGLEALAIRATEADDKRLAGMLLREARDLSAREEEQNRIQDEITAGKSSGIGRRVLQRLALLVIASAVVKPLIHTWFDTEAAPSRSPLIVTEKVPAPAPEQALVPEPLPKHLRDSLGLLVGSVVLGPLFDTLVDGRVDLQKRMDRFDTARIAIEAVLGIVDPLIQRAPHDEDARLKLAGFLPALKNRLTEFEAGYEAYGEALESYNGVVGRVGEHGLSGKFHGKEMPRALTRLLREYRERVASIETMVKGTAA